MKPELFTETLEFTATVEIAKEIIKTENINDAYEVADIANLIVKRIAENVSLDLPRVYNRCKDHQRNGKETDN